MLFKQEDPVPRYVINFDELLGNLKDDLAKLVAKELKDHYPQITAGNLEDLLEDIKNRMPSASYKTLSKTINMLINKDAIYGIQKIEGKLLDVPPLIKQNTATFKFDQDVYLTGLHFNQTGWKNNDNFFLCINNTNIINKSYTKEIGEHKYFNKFYYVVAKTPVDFILDNKSGNSRQTLIDLEYIEKGTPPPIPPPEPDPNAPSVDDIKNEWDIAVVMNWESGPADIDLHGFIGNKHIWYGNTEETNFHLNFDFTSHLKKLNPEILSVKGYQDQSLQIYVHNFSHSQLEEPVNIKIYGKDSSSNPIILKEYNKSLIASKAFLIGVCTINLNTQEILDLDEQKAF